tara:strand:- start:779 stop:1012 length:234 start_codon:yes stop_codon:yes gene_type:complete
MSDIHFKSGDLCWICIWDENSKKFYKVCGTVVQYTKSDWVEVLAVSRIFERKINEINKFENKNDFLPWPIIHKDANY